MHDAAIDDVLEAVADAHELEHAVRSRQRHDAPRPRHRHRLQGRRSRRPRRSRSSTSSADGSVTLYTEHGRHGPGLGHRDGADRRPRCSTSTPKQVRVVHPDTDVTPYDMGTLGSRSTFHMGNAVRLAAEDARDQLARACRRGRAARGHQLSAGGDFQETLRHAGRQRHRHRRASCRATSRRTRRPACPTMSRRSG